MTSFMEPHIVAGVDGSETSTAATEWAAAEASRRHLTLRLVQAYIAPMDIYPGSGMVAPDLSEMARAWARNVLAENARRLGQLYPELRLQTALRYGHAVTVLKEESRDALMTVVGSHGRNRFAGAVLGSVASGITAHAGSPVVVVRTHDGVAAPSTTGDIVVGVDDSPHTQTAIGFAFDEAAVRGVDLVAVHTWDDQPIRRAMAGLSLSVDEAAISAEERRVLAEQLGGWADKYPDVTVHQRVEVGHPAERLSVHSAPSSNGSTRLLVVGSRGRGGFSGLLLGSTSAQLIAHASCPVAVVPDPSGIAP